MKPRTFDSVEKLVTTEGVSGVLFALMAVMQNVIDDTDHAFGDQRLAQVWRKAQGVIRKAIADLPKSQGIK